MQRQASTCNTGQSRRKPCRCRMELGLAGGIGMSAFDSSDRASRARAIAPRARTHARSFETHLQVQPEVAHPLGLAPRVPRDHGPLPSSACCCTRCSPAAPPAPRRNRCRPPPALPLPAALAAAAPTGPAARLGCVPLAEGQQLQATKERLIRAAACEQVCLDQQGQELSAGWRVTVLILITAKTQALCVICTPTPQTTPAHQAECF